VIGGEPRVLAFMRDVTEQLQAEQRLRASEARYRLLFEMESDAIMLADAQTLHPQLAHVAESMRRRCTCTAMRPCPSTAARP
jgi:PAS domain-containing protein